jgi:hypothetical protein
MFAPLVDFFTGRSSAWKAKYNAAFVTLVNPNTGEPYVASGGGGGGGFADILYTDDTGVVFVYRDDGAGGAMGAYRVPTGAVYTVGANPRPYDPATSPLPTGASTSALQTTGNSSLSSIDGKVPALVSGRTPVDGSGVTQPISAAALPLPSGAATETTLSAINNKTSSLITTPPAFDVSASTVRVVGENTASAGFSAVGASVLDSFFVQTPKVGTGVSYSQAAGSLSVVSGTTTNAEFLARSVASFEGAMRMRFSIIASQRIVNSNFAVMLGDLVGENLTYTINSATSVTVAVPGNTFDATNVGQFVNIAGITGAAGIPGRYAIASVVTGTSITFTVAGWPATGTGTCTLFGRNYVRNLVTGATATALAVDAQRNGWATGDTTATINTTASPGALVQVELTGREVFWSDALRASSTSPSVTTRASRYENIPDQASEMYVWLWNFNGSTAPASSTTFTLGHVSVENFPNLPVFIEGLRSTGQQNPLNVSLAASQTLATVTAVTTVSIVNAANLNTPTPIADVTSAALTTTTTTAAFTPTYGITYEVNIPVTAVTGTSPTLDVSIEESDDSGTNWYKVYDFPRITAVGMYRSPTIPLVGNRVRYVQTVGGTTPSFTRAVNRLQSSYPAMPVRQLIDRTIVLTTLGSTTPSLISADCGNRVQLVINIGAVTTTAPALQLQGSDDNGTTWYSIGTPLTAVASSTVQLTVTDINSQLTRAIVTTAGVGVTAGYVTIKAHD